MPPAGVAGVDGGLGEGKPAVWRRGATDESIKSRIEPTAAKATSDERGRERSDFSQKVSSCGHWGGEAQWEDDEAQWVRQAQ